MAQHVNVIRPRLRYTRTDYTALRYLLNGIAPARIVALLYPQDEPLQEAELAARLTTLRDELIARASTKNPGVAELLRDARASGRFSAKVADFILSCAEHKAEDAPSPEDALRLWFRPILCRALADCGILNVGALKAYLQGRGRSWWRGVPRLGAGKARVVERWFETTGQGLGPIAWPHEVEVTRVVTLLPSQVAPGGQALPRLAQIGAIGAGLDGAAGVNRNPGYCQISATNDLEAIRAYLYRYRDPVQRLTHTAYERELERFLLWCVLERHIALSSCRMEDCEAYKDFLANTPSAWQGTRRARKSSAWRPFAGQLSPKSARYAMRVVRALFQWLADVGYLSGNPWKTVSDPKVAAPLSALQIDKALSQETWQGLSREGGWLDEACALAQQALPTDFKGAQQARQLRAARAAILLIGSTGIRRAEAASAHTDHLSRAGSDLWALNVLGKRNKWREVYFPQRVMQGLKAHWADRITSSFLGPDQGKGQEALVSGKLLCPVTSVGRNAKRTLDEAEEQGFCADSLTRLVVKSLRALSEDTRLDMPQSAREELLHRASHALRHTFATLAVGNETAPMPLDVAQHLLGHESLQTTSIYVRAKRERSIAAVRALARGAHQEQGPPGQ